MRQRYSADDADAGAGTPFLHNNNNNTSHHAVTTPITSLSATSGNASSHNIYNNNFNHHHHHNNTNTNNGRYGPPIIIESAPSSANTIHSTVSDLEFFDDKISDPVLVLGLDITHWSDRDQFTYCAGGVFLFSLAYGYLQELLSVRLCSRQLGLFLAYIQFLGYTILAYLMRQFVYHKHSFATKPPPIRQVPLAMYLGLSLLRAIDLAMTNLAMQYINYPAKTLIKSSRVVFTMLFGVLIHNKVYKLSDYIIVALMVIGLGSFLHADSQSSAVFEIRGVLMLTISLLCDGMICNVSETILKQYGVGQDEFIFRLYSISLLCIGVAAAVNGDLQRGLVWSVHDGTYNEYLQMTTTAVDANPTTPTIVIPSYSALTKLLIMVLFSSMGFFGSSCSAAITKHFGALTMSITSTARKATTLFLSFGLFRDNVCTMEHIFGMLVFMVALVAKSMKRKGRGGGGSSSSKRGGGSSSSSSTLLKKKHSSSSLMIPLVSPPASTATMETRSSASLVHVV